MFIDNFGYLILLLAILFHVTLKKDSNYSETCKIKIKTSLLQTQTNQNYVCVIHAEFLKKNTQHFQFQLNKIEYSFAKCFADYNYYYLSRNNINQSFSSRLESSKHRDTRLPSEVSSFKPKTKQIILPYRITHLAARGLLSRGSRTTGEGGGGCGREKWRQYRTVLPTQCGKSNDEARASTASQPSIEIAGGGARRRKLKVPFQRARWMNGRRSRRLADVASRSFNDENPSRPDPVSSTASVGEPGRGAKFLPRRCLGEIFPFGALLLSSPERSLPAR